MSEQMRKEFEEWARKEGYCTTIYPQFPNEYASGNTENLWNGWQASRAALVVELPKPETDGMSEVVSLIDVEDALDAAGVKYK